MQNYCLPYIVCSQGVKKTKSVMPKNDLEKVAKICTKKMIRKKIKKYIRVNKSNQNIQNKVKIFGENSD